MRTTHTAVAAALIVVVAIAGSTPAHATGTGTDELEAALELVELTEQVAAEHTQDGALDANDQRESELTVDVDENTAELELFDATVTVALPVEVVAHVGELPTGDSVIVTEDDAAFAALEKEDGSVQVVYSISGSDSPTRFPFEIATDADGQWHTMDNGSVLLLDGEGSIIVGAAAPWAVDAAGVSVPTRFELADGVLTQVVDHRTQDVSYPIVADPYLGRDLFSSVTRDTYNGDLRINATKSIWGQSQHLPTPAGWQIFFTAGWNEVKARQPRVTEKLTLLQQYECHVAGGYFNSAGPWNLEKFRPDRTALAGWGWLVAFHRCNWATASGGERS
ncbi:hypothetical protein [Cellulomonas sp. KH9]|uniref:hypothetical protein n=1 Tax=Cellulomonas sp. KH9 TaxID=1855324 RepID=UPI0008EC0265|nr:hypothetical protein [Cellulomonas sp. KH9]SFK49502.1 hypothetical protein SAMN05216467_3604 [Cellulomonas sp. KH9]